jgi:hypothetical protein
LWCVASTVGKRGEFKDVAVRASDVIRDRGLSGEVDVGLALLSRKIFARLEIRVAALEDLATRTLETIREAGDLDAAARRELSLIYALLPETGGAPDYGLLLTRLARSDSLALIQADEPLVRTILKELGAASDFGKYTPPFENGLLDWFPGVLEAWLFDALSNYELDLASNVLRILVYLGWCDRPSCHEAVRFVLGQQGAHGCFGFFPQRSEEVSALHRSLTLSWVWTLSEYGWKSFRLVHS